MCGRATLTSPAEDVASLFDVDPIDIGPPRFNIPPSQPMLTVRERRLVASPSSSSSASSSSAEDAELEAREARAGWELTLMRWGLIPWWAKAEEAKKVASKCVQARAETVTRSPAYRDAFKRHRCLVVVDGFFEWKTLPDGRKIPHHVRRSERRPFAIAGIWDSWRASGEPIESCAVVTMRSGGVLRDLHDRMPLVLRPEEWATWTSGTTDEATALLAQDAPVLDERARDLVALPVSTWVNDVRHDDPRCIEPVAIEASTSEPGSGQIDFGFGEGAAARSPARPRKRTSAR